MKTIPPKDQAANERRNARIRVVFSKNDDRIGQLIVGGETWGAVEWSEKRGVWCIEDAEGRCLRHASSIHGKAAAKEEAIALAEQLVRDGTLPSPEEARRLRHEARKREREKRAKRPSEIRRKQERAERDRLWDEHWQAEAKERNAPPFFEIFAEAFDLADPELWRSNSFAMVRPRLLLEVKAAVAELQCRALEQHYRYPKHRDPELEHSLARAREILKLLDDGGQ
jgi:hypothetical protein